MTKQKKERRWVRWVVLGGLIALIVLLILYGTCFGGWGMGGGEGSGTQTARQAVSTPAVDAGSPRCLVRLDAAGVSLDGEPSTQDAVIVACTKAKVAEVTVTGDAKFGAWEELKRALDAAGVEVVSRGVAPSAPL